MAMRRRVGRPRKLPPLNHTRTAEQEKPLSQESSQMDLFLSGLKTASTILHEEHLSCKLLNSYVYVDMHGVTINPYNYMKSTTRQANLSRFNVSDNEDSRIGEPTLERVHKWAGKSTVKSTKRQYRKQHPKQQPPVKRMYQRKKIGTAVISHDRNTFSDTRANTARVQLRSSPRTANRIGASGAQRTPSLSLLKGNTELIDISDSESDFTGEQKVISSSVSSHASDSEESSVFNEEIEKPESESQLSTDEDETREVSDVKQTPQKTMLGQVSLKLKKKVIESSDSEGSSNIHEEMNDSTDNDKVTVGQQNEGKSKESKEAVSDEDSSIDSMKKMGPKSRMSLPNKNNKNPRYIVSDSEDESSEDQQQMIKLDHKSSDQVELDIFDVETDTENGPVEISAAQVAASSDDLMQVDDIQEVVEVTETDNESSVVDKEAEANNEGDDTEQMEVEQGAIDAPKDDCKDISTATSTQELFDILAGQDNPESFSDQEQDDSSPAKSLNVNKHHHTLMQEGKKLAAETMKLIGISLDPDETSDEKTVDMEVSDEAKTPSDKEFAHSDLVKSCKSLNEVTDKKRAPFKLRFSKTFDYQKHACTDCKTIFRKNVDLQLHALQHLDRRTLTVRVFRAILPRTFDTSKYDIDRYLRPRPKSRLKPIDVDVAKSLIGKYCKDESFLEPFDSVLDGDISQATVDEDTPNLSTNVVVVSNITVRRAGDVRIVTAGDDITEEAMLDDTQVIDTDVIPETQETVGAEGKGEDFVVVVPNDKDGHDTQEDEGTQIIDTKAEAINVSDAEAETVPETQCISTDEDVVKHASSESLGEETESLNTDPTADEGTQIIEQDTEGPIDSNGISAAATDDEEGGEIEEETASQQNTTDDMSLVIMSDDESSEAVKNAENKRKRSWEGERPSSQIKKSKPIDEEAAAHVGEEADASRSSNTSDDFVSCVDATSPAAGTVVSDHPVASDKQDQQTLCIADASPSKCSETSDAENVEELLKMAHLDNQLQTIFENTAMEECAGGLDTTMTEADLASH